ncbi:MAG: YciI family protein [Steroidobacteraceae bacterium]
MRYIFLIYSRETDRASLSAEENQAVMSSHRAVQDEATRRGVLQAAQPLQRTPTATTVRMQDGKPLIVDGPFAETKEQLAGYYLIDCRDLDQAIEWAQKIPSGCRGAPGCIEIRPLLELPAR